VDARIARWCWVVRMRSRATYRPACIAASPCAPRASLEDCAPGAAGEGMLAMAEANGEVALRDPDALVKEIERTRENLARTIDTLTQRVSPANVARRALSRVLAGGAASVEGARPPLRPPLGRTWSSWPARCRPGGRAARP